MQPATGTLEGGRQLAGLTGLIAEAYT